MCAAEALLRRREALRLGYTKESVHGGGSEMLRMAACAAGDTPEADTFYLRPRVLLLVLQPSRS